MVFFYKGWRKGCCACRITFLFFLFSFYVYMSFESQSFEGSQRGIFWVIGSFVFAVVLRRESSFIVEVKKKKKKKRKENSYKRIVYFRYGIITFVACIFQSKE